MSTLNPEAISLDDMQARKEDASLKSWISLFVLLLASFMNFIDVTIVNVALPTLQKSFNASPSQIEWVVAGFVLFFALGLLPFGRLGDIISRRNLFLTGIFLFTLTSALCGLAQSMEVLIGARILQGIGGAIMMPQVISIIYVTFPKHQHGTAFALFGMSAGLAAVSGPIAGGLLIEANFFEWGWRSIFMVNIPIGIFAIIAAVRLLPKMPGNSEMKMDWVGTFLSVIAMLLIIFPLIEGRTFGWPVWTYVMMGMSVLAFTGFYFWQRRQAHLGGAELLPVRLLANRNFLIGVGAITFFFSGLPGFFMAFALFLQLGFSFTPLMSGFTTIPFPIGILLATVVSGALGSRWLKLRLIFGMLTLITGMYLLMMSVQAVAAPLDGARFIPFLIIAGIGMGTAIPAMFETVLSGVPQRDAGSGSGALQALQQVGGALGVALIGHVFFTTLTETVTSAPPGPANFVSAMSNSIVYELVVFGIVALLALMMRPGVDVAE